jgi:RND family efflux transporter MFP subunit
MKQSIKLTLLLAVLLSLFVSCEKEEVYEEIIRPVRYKQVFLTGGFKVRILTGTAKADIESNLSFKVQGTIENMNVKVGDRVIFGQVLAQLDPKDYRIRVQEAEAALTQAKSQELNAENNYDRVRKLYENRSASRSELDQARSQFESVSANVDRLESGLELARLQLGYTKLTAPINGVIAEKLTEVNENVKAGQIIYTLSSVGRTEVSVNVPEVLISNIQRGDKVSLKFDAIRDKEFLGTVNEVGISTGSFSTTYPVTIKIDNPTPEIRPGMSANVQFTFEQEGSPTTILVPPSSVGEDEQGRYVFIALHKGEGDGEVKKQYVEVGELTSEGLEVLNGLSDGELIVTAGISKINDGQKVKLLGL